MFLISTETLFWFLKYSNLCDFFFFLSRVSTFQNKVKNGKIVTLSCLHKLSILFFGTTLLTFFELNHQKSSSDGSLKKKLLNIFGNLQKD